MAAGSMPQTQPPAVVAALPVCAPGALVVAFDAEGGAFDGMSHSGALLVVRNIGPKACRLPGLPALGFADAAGRSLPVVRRAPPGMHPGPAMVPVGLAAGAEATAELRWVSGAVFGGGGGRCLATASVTVGFGDPKVTAPLAATICGPDGAPAAFEQQALRVDPVLAP